MRLRSFFKGLLATPLVAPRMILAGEKPERVMLRVLEMGTYYGTPVLIFILPDKKRLVFIHDREMIGQIVEYPWKEYRGDWRDLDVIPWRGGGFPDYRFIEHGVRFRYDYA